MRSRCIKVIAIQRLFFDLHGIRRRRGVGAAHPAAPIVPLIERIYRLLCTGAVTVPSRRVVIPLKPVFAVDRRNVFTRSMPVGRGTAPGVREVSLIPAARVGRRAAAASPCIAGAVTVHMRAAVGAVVIVIPVQRCGLYLRGIAGRYGIGRPVAPCAVIAPHRFGAGERPAGHGVGGTGRCQLISRPVALLRFNVLIGNPSRLGRRPVRPVAFHIIFGILIIAVCAADEPVRTLRAAPFPASVHELMPCCRDCFGFFRLARGAGVRLDAGFLAGRSGRHRSAVPAVSLCIGVIILVAGAANRTGIQGIALLRTSRSNDLRRVGVRRVAGISVRELDGAVQNGLFNRFALESIAVIGTVIILDLYLDVKIIASGRCDPVKMHCGVQLRVVQVFGAHLFGSTIAHGSSPCMDRSGNGADVRISRRDRPVNGIAIADRKRRRDIFPAGGNPVFNGGIAVICHLAELGINIAHRSVRQTNPVPVMIRGRYVVFIKRRYCQARPGGDRLDHGGRGVCLIAARQRPHPVVLRHLHGQIGRVVVAFGEVSGAFSECSFWYITFRRLDNQAYV